jgi:hypothetical protein
MKRSSTTRNYIGAVTALADLRLELGEFSTIDEFYEYWRAMPVTRVAVPPEPETIALDEAIEGNA